MEIWRRAAKTASFRSMLACVRMAGEVAHSGRMLEGAREHFAWVEGAADRAMQVLPPELRDRHAVADAWTATRSVRRAIRRTTRIVRVHTRCGDVFSLCATSMAVQESAMAPWWHEWRQRHAHAATQAYAALESLRSAWTNGDATLEYLCRLGLTEPPDWDEWGPDILIHLDEAGDDIRDAMAALEVLEQALLVEYATARRLLRDDMY